MATQTSTTFDFLAIGEALVDLISKDPALTLADAGAMQPFAGGQTANLARNMALLGQRSALAACVGDDGFARFLIQENQQAGVDVSCIQVTTQAPTTLACVTKTPGGTPEFLIYRGADSLLQSTPDLLAAAGQSKIIHTSAFALSRNPARSTILDALQVAHQAGRLISLDPNYHPRVWPDRPDFLAIIKEICANVDVTKPSLDDCTRMFGPGQPAQTYAERFLDWGVKMVILTLGHAGILVATDSSTPVHIAPNPVHVVDVTGAGDAFWAGFLTAYLEGLRPIQAAQAGQILAEMKIQSFGPLQQGLDFKMIKQQAQANPNPLI